MRMRENKWRLTRVLFLLSVAILCVAVVANAASAPSQTGQIADRWLFWNLYMEAKLKRLATEDRIGDEEREQKKILELYNQIKPGYEAGVISERLFLRIKLAVAKAPLSIDETKAQAKESGIAENIWQRRFETVKGEALLHSDLPKQYIELWKAKADVLSSAEKKAELDVRYENEHLQSLLAAYERGAVANNLLIEARFRVLETECTLDVTRSMRKAAQKALGDAGLMSRGSR